MDTKIAIFKGKRIRKVIHNNEWWFSVIDVIEVLAGTQRPRKYWSDLKKKINKEGYNELSDKIGQLKLLSSDGKFYLTDCVNTETMFRLIQSIPSPKAEPFKRWLKSDAKAGGAIAGNARRELEKKIKRTIVSRGNFLSQLKKINRGVNRDSAHFFS